MDRNYLLSACHDDGAALVPAGTLPLVVDDVCDLKPLVSFFASSSATGTLALQLKISWTASTALPDATQYELQIFRTQEWQSVTFQVPLCTMAMHYDVPACQTGVTQVRARGIANS